jgi:Na+/melibiose symporter-like transporter
MAGSVIMFAAILISAAGTHDRIPSLRVPPVRKLTLPVMAREMISTWNNRSFLFLTLAGLATSMAAGLSASMNIYFGTWFWEFTSRQFSYLIMGVFASAFLALFFAPRLSRRFGKRASAIGALMLSVIISLGPLALRLLGLMPPNHTPALFGIIFAQSIVSTALYIAASTLMSAMIADVVEDGELKTGRRAEGLFFSASTLVAKAVSGMGILAAAAILNLIHFPAGARPGLVAPDVIRDLALTYLPIMLALYAGALLLLTGYKITRASHAETLTLLAAQAERVAEGV